MVGKKMRDPRLYKPLKRGENEQELRRIVKPQPPQQQNIPKATPASGVGWDQQPSERPNVPGTLFTYGQRLDFLGRRTEQIIESEEATYYHRNHRPIAWEVGINGRCRSVSPIEQHWVSTLRPVLLEFINYDLADTIDLFIGQYANWNGGIPIAINTPTPNYVRIEPGTRFFIDNLNIDQNSRTEEILAGADYDPQTTFLVSIVSSGVGVGTGTEYFIRFGFDEFAEVFEEDL